MMSSLSNGLGGVNAEWLLGVAKLFRVGAAK